MEHQLYLQTLGGFDLLWDGVSLLGKGNRHLRYMSILLFLLAKKTPISAEMLVEQLWPDQENQDPKNYIRVYVHRMRQMLSGKNALHMDVSPWIQIKRRGTGYQVELAEGAICDSWELERYCNMKQVSSPETILNQLLSLYQGEYLKGVPEDEWKYGFSNYYSRLFSRTTVELLEQLESMGHHEQVVELGEKCIQLQELDEGMNLCFMKGLLAIGRAGDAFRHHNYITRKMYEEFNLPQSPEMKQLYRCIRQALGDADVAVSVKESALPLNELLRTLIMTQPGMITAAMVSIHEDSTDIQCHRLKSALPQLLEENDMYAQINRKNYLVLLQGAHAGALSDITKCLEQMVADHYLQNKLVNVQVLDLKSVPQMNRAIVC